MSYEHCDIHDQDATNGCLKCEQERIDGLTDVAILEEVELLLDTLSMARPRQEEASILSSRVGAIADRLRPAKVAPPCKCNEWDAGPGGPWLAAYGLFARERFLAWRGGRRHGHHPQCEHFYDDW